MNADAYKAALESVKAGKTKPEDHIMELSTAELERLELEIKTSKERKAERKAATAASVPPPPMKLSEHAVRRLKQRFFGDMEMSDDKARRWFAKMAANGRMHKADYADRKARLLQNLGHNFEDTDYYIDDNGNVYVVVKGVVKTVHRNEAKRYVRKD